MAGENGTGSVDTGATGDAGNSGDAGTLGNTGSEASTFSQEQWREMVSEEWATDASMADFKSVDDLAKSYVHAQKLIGSDDRVRIPKEDDTDNWKKFYNKIGRPEDPSGYEFKIPEKAPKGYESEEFQKYAQDFRQTVHDLGLSKKQAENLWEYQQKTNLDVYQQQDAKFKEQLTTLEDTAKKEFGAKLPEVIKLRNDIISQYGGEEVGKFIDENPLVNRSPSLLKMFEKLGKALGEDKITREVKDRAFSPREAKSKLMSITTDKSNPMYEAYHKTWHPNHDEAVKQVNKLFDFMGSK